MSTATLSSLLDYLCGTLTPSNMRWVAEHLTEYADRQEHPQSLEPYTMEELRERIAKSERDFAEGNYLTSEDLFKELDKEFHFLGKEEEENVDLQFQEAV